MVCSTSKEVYKAQPENDRFRLYYDQPIVPDKKVTNNLTDIVVLNKMVNVIILIDIVVPNNNIFLVNSTKNSGIGLVTNALHNNIAKLWLHENTYIETQEVAIINTYQIVTSLSIESIHFDTASGT